MTTCPPYPRRIHRCLVVLALIPALLHCGEESLPPLGPPGQDATLDSPAIDSDGGAPVLLDTNIAANDAIRDVRADGHRADEDVSPHERETQDTGARAAPQPAPVRYELARTHSPRTAFVAQRVASIRSLAPEHPDNVFMKAGDSISYSSKSLFCFSGAEVVLDSFAGLEDTLNYFLAGELPEGSPFDRKSLAVLGAKTATWATTGSPSPLVSEINAITPSSAIVMFGTNDSGSWPTDRGKMLRAYGGAIFELVDTLIASGVVPILMTIPPRSNKAAIGQLAPLTNAVIRGLAQGHQIPLIDYYREMLLLPDWGLSSDGVHPSALSAAEACHLNEEGLQFGYNLRNLLSLEGLDRLRSLVPENESLWEEAPPPALGEGAPETPFVVGTLPFTHWVDTAISPHAEIDNYPGCGATQDESGPEWYYRLTLTQPTPLRIAVLDREGVDIDIHLMSESGPNGACLARNHTLIEGTLPAGEYGLVLDSFVSEGAVLSGEALLIVVPCEPEDGRCTDSLLASGP